MWHKQIMCHSNNSCGWSITCHKEFNPIWILEPIFIYFSPEALQNDDLQTVGQTVGSKEEEKQVEDAEWGMDASNTSKEAQTKLC